MTTPGGAKRRSRLRRPFIFLGALAAVFLAILLSGYPQKWVVEWAIQRNSGMIAEVEWGGIFPELRVASAHLYLNKAAYLKREPLASATRIRVRYSLFARGRRIDSVTIGTLVVDADPGDSARRETHAAPNTSPAKAAAADATYLPREITVQDLALKLHRADGTSVFAELGGIRADITSADSMSIAVRNRAGRVAFDAGDAHVSLPDVAMFGEGRYENGELTWNQSAEAPGVFRAVLKAKGPLSGDGAHLDVKIDQAAFAGDRLDAFLKSAATPLRFSELGIESSTGRITFGERTTFNLSMAARMYAPRTAGTAEPLYNNAIRISLSADNAETLNVEATVAFAKGQRVQMALHGDAREGSASAVLDGWTRAQLVEALPAAFRESVEGLGFDTFSSDAAVKWTKTGYEVSGRAESKGGGAEAAPIVWAVQAHGARDGGQSIEGTAEARLGDRRVRASARYDGGDHYLAEASIEEVKIAPWVRLFAGEEAAKPFEGTIAGTVRAEAKGKDAPFEIRPDLTLKKFVYDTLELDEITAKGSLRYAQGERRWTIDDLRAEAPDGLTAVALTGWDYEVSKKSGGGAFSLGADLGIVARLIGVGGLTGSGSAEGKVRLDAAKIETQLSFKSGDLGLRDIWLPTSTKLTGSGALTFDRKTRSGMLTGWQAAIGGGTKLHVENASFSTGPLVADGDLISESDLQVLVAMNWLSSAEGRLNERSKIHIAGDKLHMDWDLRVAAPKLTLTANAGSAEGAEFDGRGSYDGALSGTGQIRAAKLMAAGGSVVNAAGPVLFDGESMWIQQAKGDLFRGSIRADVIIGVLTEDLPIKLSGYFEDCDLAIMSDEVKPPKTQLTGKARGSIEVKYGLKGLTDFTFESEAPAGLSVNRSLVEELLQTDKFLSGASANVAERAMDKLLGTAPQRPFERGRLNVELADNKITGLAVLESQQTKDYHGLNLHVTLDMDQPALAEALKMLQESSTTSIERR